LSLYWGVFLLLYGQLRSTWYKPLLAGALWVTLEAVRSYLLTGFPWALLAHTQSSHPIVVQTAAFTGALGISFAIVLVNAALAEKKWRSSGAIALGVIGAMLIGGAVRLAQARVPGPASLRVALLQGDIDQYQKWDDAYESDIRTQYETLALKAASEPTDLIVWPESAIPGWYPNEEFYAKWVDGLVRATKTFHLIGAVTRDDERELNSAFLLDANGHIQGRYDKAHLVPFGEYIPFGNIFKKWIPYLGHLGIFDAGDHGVLLPMNGLSISVNICYEAMFTTLVRSSVNGGADLIVNLTNDGWFLKTAAPEQHYATNIFRAVENGRTVVRGANTGISAVIDAYGRERVRSQLMERGVYRAEAPVYSPPIRTVYGMAGPWFGWACGLLTLIYYTALYVTRTKRKNHRPF
jgi:apolipoprotein N-acyltransferase